jgi:hypothetical protein
VIEQELQKLQIPAEISAIRLREDGKVIEIDAINGEIQSSSHLVFVHPETHDQIEYRDGLQRFSIPEGELSSAIIDVPVFQELIDSSLQHERSQIWKSQEYTLPQWAVYPIEYGTDGYATLSDEEIQLLEDFLDQLPGTGHFSWGEENEFARDNDLDRFAGGVIEATYVYQEQTVEKVHEADLVPEGTLTQSFLEAMKEMPNPEIQEIAHDPGRRPSDALHDIIEVLERDQLTPAEPMSTQEQVSEFVSRIQKHYNLDIGR